MITQQFLLALLVACALGSAALGMFVIGVLRFEKEAESGSDEDRQPAADMKAPMSPELEAVQREAHRAALQQLHGGAKAANPYPKYHPHHVPFAIGVAEALFLADEALLEQMPSTSPT